MGKINTAAGGKGPQLSQIILIVISPNQFGDTKLYYIQKVIFNQVISIPFLHIGYVIVLVNVIVFMSHHFRGSISLLQSKYI